VKPMVAVVGPATCTDNQADIAEAVGKIIAERGAIVVCGGRGGVMEAVCKGAVSSGGITVGILPGTDANEGNPYLSVSLPTGLGEARNTLIARAGQAMIAIGGSYGTLSEIALALKFGRKVVGLETWSASDHIGRQLGLLWAKDALAAVKMALAQVNHA